MENQEDKEYPVVNNLLLEVKKEIPHKRWQEPGMESGNEANYPLLYSHKKEIVVQVLPQLIFHISIF